MNLYLTRKNVPFILENVPIAKKKKTKENTPNTQQTKAEKPPTESVYNIYAQITNGKDSKIKIKILKLPNLKEKTHKLKNLFGAK